MKKSQLAAALWKCKAAQAELQELRELRQSAGLDKSAWLGISILGVEQLTREFLAMERAEGFREQRLEVLPG